MSQAATADELDEIAVKNFQEYLRIPSVHPHIDYEPCIVFLKQLANDIDLPIKIIYPNPSNPVAIVTWQGQNPSLPTLLLNSHMDVVPVDELQWSHSPFGAEIHEGRVFARGSQDMKCIGIQYLEAIRRLKQQGMHLVRTIHCTFVPDEETGGALGMKQFVKTQDFQDLNVGAALDEGLPSIDDTFLVYYGERCMWHITFVCPGQRGHGSLLLEDTAAEKLARLLDLIMTHRKSQVEMLRSDASLTIGDVMTLNVTILSGGQQANVLPGELKMTMDCRIPVSTSEEEWSQMLDEWCTMAGDGVYMQQSRFENAKPTNINEDSTFWRCFRDVVVDKLGLRITTRIFPGGTDSRFLRQLGIPAFGFSPIDHHPVLLHDTDEFLSVDTFLRGICGKTSKTCCSYYTRYKLDTTAIRVVVFLSS